MTTDTPSRIDLNAIKNMAKEAAKKASQESDVRIVGSSTVVATYSGHKQSSLNREKKNIDKFFGRIKKQ